MGREDIILTPTGWTATGRYDLGLQKGEYNVRFERGRRWSVQTPKGGLEAQFRDGKFVVGDKSIDLEEHPRPFIYLNLSWIHLYEFCRLRPKAGDAVTLLIPQGCAPVPARVVDAQETPQLLNDRTVRVRVYVLEVAGVELHVLASPEGLPLRIECPAQSVEVVLAGFEPLRLPPAAPKTIVDSGAWREKLSSPAHEVELERKIRIPMRDGVRLAADVYRPRAPGRYPTILIRTPYGRAFEGARHGGFFAPRGYAVVAQDVRGRGDSEGEWFPIKNETDDGSDTIDWIAKQPWSDGAVGMIGGSYAGWVQWYAAKSGNPRLKAIVPQVAPPDPDQNFPYEGGCLMLAAWWWARVLDAQGELPKLDWNRVLQTLPLSELDTAVGTNQRFLDEWLQHPPDDSAYWGPQRYQTHLDRMNVAALHVTGWYDGDQPGALLNFSALRRLGRKDQYLIVGPWTHAFNTTKKIGDIDFGPEAVIDLDAVTLRFFDRYLKGIDNGIDREDPVFIFVMGPNLWRREKEWPPPQSRPTKLYLAGEKTHKASGGGRLTLAPQDSPPSEYKYDPTDTPQTLGDWNDLSGAAATADHSKLPDREDTLDFTSPELAAPVEITGPITAVLSVSTDAADTDFAVDLFVRKPDGKIRRIQGGVQRLRYRSGRDEPVRPGDVVTVEVDCWATSVRLQEGDRIVVQVGSWVYPAYARNLNTLEPQFSAREPVIATNRVYHDSERLSYIQLPVIGTLEFR